MSIIGTTDVRIAAPSISAEPPRAAPPQPPAASLPVVASTGVNVVAAAAAKPAPPSQEDVQRAIAEVNKYLKESSNGIQFSLDQDSGKTIVKIVDPETQTVIRQIPTEQAVAISKDLAKLQGLLVREKA